MSPFGTMLQTRRAELRLSLREFARRSDLDPGNASRIERGRVQPPQAEDVLARIADALQFEPESVERATLFDLAATENGRVPVDIMSDEEAVRQLPLLFRTVRNKAVDPEKVEKLLRAIQEA